MRSSCESEEQMLVVHKTNFPGSLLQTPNKCRRETTCVTKASGTEWFRFWLLKEYKQNQKSLDFLFALFSCRSLLWYIQHKKHDLTRKRSKG